MSHPNPSSPSADSQRYTQNSIVWNELITPDTGAAIKFYGSLFGWTTETMPLPGKNYIMLKHGGETFGGTSSVDKPGVPAHWLHYIAVASLEAVIEKATPLGATVCLPPTDIGSAGRIAVLKDPQGAVFGLHQI